MRILFITNAFPNPYQPHRGIFNLGTVKGVSQGHEVRVISPISWWDELVTRRRSGTLLPRSRKVVVDGMEVHYPRFYFTPKLLRRFYGSFLWHSVAGTVRKLLKEQRPDVVLGYWAHPDGEVAVRAARLAGVPAAVVVGGSDVLLLAKNRVRRRCIANVLRAADAVVTIGQNLREKVMDLGVPAARVHAIHRGVDLDMFSPGNATEARRRLSLPAEGKILLAVGRMVPVKGLDVLIQACADLAGRGVAFHAVLVGDGPLRSSLREQARRLGLADRVTFVGAVGHDRLADWYRAADVTVLPSRSEGIPNVLRESKACGTPFVASRVGGVHEIAAGPTCRLVPPDDPRALADALAAAPLKADGNAAPLPSPRSWAESAEELLVVLGPLVARADRAEAPPSARPRRLHQAVRAAMSNVLPRRLFLTRGPAESKAVCLTFDDGPHPDHTPRLLDVLKEQNLTATFFVVGKEVERHPEIVRRMVAEGHAVGNHTFSHDDPGTVSWREFVAEVRKTDDVLADVAGGDWFLVRPPHGKVTAAKLLGLWRDRRTVVLWNADPKDYACRSAAELGGWFRARPPQGGDIVLLHDKMPFAAEVIPELAAAVRGRGLTFATPIDWLDKN